ncbi:MAG TPA: histidinol dehydrogenase [Pyrinomonadaceae bacterium]|jgi:histidinol dehydrogenase|nr:histidinol dehydrogenase [Pyrinomonadaceae bacterium]
MIRLIPTIDRRAREQMLAKIKARSVVFDRDLLSSVSSIIDDIRNSGDTALIDYTRRFDRVGLRPQILRVDPETLRSAAAKVDPCVLESMRDAIANVQRFHERQIETSWEFKPRPGVVLGQRITPIDSVGVYVPGGTAAYPSSVIMNVVPAQIAGVKRIVVATPPRTITENPAVAAAVVELKISEAYGIGGAQAIAALAFGTETVPRVDKITGPGNRYVAAAKKLVFGAVDIDSIAGPTEVVIVADETANAAFVAADMLAQAEHAEDASAILITTSESLAGAVADELAKQIDDQPRKEIIRKSLAQFGAIIIVDTLEQGCDIVNDLAPEHLQVIVADESAITSQVRHAGAIFFGSFTPEAVGDYWAGPNHVLPTAGAARFSSALGVYDFVKRTSTLRYSAEALRVAIPKIAALADAEGLRAHAESVKIRQ